MVGADGATRRDQVHDGVGQTHQRSQFHGAVQLDQIHVHALGGKVLAGGARVFGGNAQSGSLVHGAFIVETFRGGDGQPAARDVEVDGLVQPARVVGLVLIEHVLAGNAEVGRAILHVGGHVRGAHDDDAQVVRVGRQDELA